MKLEINGRKGKGIYNKINVKHFIANNVIIISLLVLLITLILIEPRFLSIANTKNILAQASVRIIIALGVGSIIVTQGIDFSVGRIIGLGAVVSASLLQALDYPYRMYPYLESLPLVVPILISMILGACIGFINGWTISKLKIPAFIATMATMIITYGITSLYFDKPPYGAQPISGLDYRYMKLGQGYFIIGEFRIPYLVIYAILVCIIMWFIWNKTKLGKAIFKIGKNMKEEEALGINTTKSIITVYSIAGALYGLAGSLEAARVGSATNNTGFMYEMDAIAACVVGGISFIGGMGSIGGIVTGVLILQVINYALVFVGVSAYIQFIIKGIIIIAAIALDARKYKTKYDDKMSLS